MTVTSLVTATFIASMSRRLAQGLLELVERELLLLERVVEPLLVALEHLLDLGDLGLDVLVGDGDAELGRLLAEHLEHHQILGQALLEGAVFLALRLLVGDAAGGLVRGLELVELVLG